MLLLLLGSRRIGSSCTVLVVGWFVGWSVGRVWRAGSGNFLIPVVGLCTVDIAFIDDIGLVDICLVVGVVSHLH
jgi:hypothetical protein